jgi:hypothetical protein
MKMLFDVFDVIIDRGEKTIIIITSAAIKKISSKRKHHVAVQLNVGWRVRRDTAQ